MGTHRIPSPNSSTAPFARLLAEYTFDAAKILSLMFSSMWALVPTSLLAGIARNICTIAIALLMAWIIINHLLYLTSQAFCAALTHLPDQLSVNIEGCIPNTQEPDEPGLLLQSLDGLSPLVPDAFQFLSNSLDDVDDKVSNLKGSIDTSQLELSTTAWKEKYIKGAQCVRDSERDFADQQRRLWESVNRYIGIFSPGSKKEPSWLDSIMGSQTRRRREAVKERRSELLSILMHAENRTSTSYTNLPIHHGKGVLNKLYNQEASQFARDITEILGGYSSCDGKDVLAVQLKELQASSTVWTASSEALASRLDKRSKMLEEDLNWLRSSLVQLKELEGKLGKRAQMEQLDDCQEEISQMAQEWRSRLKGYFVESSSKM
ncbi:hypothetical protein NM208_g7790 [Fusarium decemcellulare]|uniref:Uncharacterized protein n=1 Tax=Fusarium decemcellulare TaxID=57161 RepID=A0ACC1S7V3_9HYPO|nr:hypothetical protein NM208_g7790 [Fusarium decemcellulare]